MNEFLKAIGILAETSTQAFIAANIFGNQPKVGEDDHE